MSWNEYQAAIAEAEALLVLDSAADPVAVEASIARLKTAVENLVVGGSIRNADDFAAMDGQVGVFTLEADITITEPIQNFNAMLIGNGHIIYVESAIAENFEDAVLDNVVIIGGDIDADSLLGEAKGSALVSNTVVVLDSINGSVYFSNVAPKTYDEDEATYIVSNTVIINDAVNGEAGLVATAEAGASLAIIDIMFIGDVNGKAALVGDNKAVVIVAAAIVYANVYGEEFAAGLVASADAVGIMGAYYEGAIVAETVELYVGETADIAEESVIDMSYVYAIGADGALLPDVDVEPIHNGEATFVINYVFEILGSVSLFDGVEFDAPFVQRIGLDATPVIGEPNADGSNVVIYDEENDTYKNVYALGQYVDGMFADHVVPTAPLAPNYETLNYAIDMAEGLDEDDYTAESWAALAAALEAAMDARTARSQAEIDAALADLVFALATLRVPTPAVAPETSADVAGLQASIAAAEALKAEDYTAESWADLQAVLASAKKILTGASQTVVDNAKASLDAMVAGLVKKTVEAPAAVDYSALNAAIASAKELKEADYTAESWAKVKSALEAANDATTAATQEAVNEAKYALNYAVAGLVVAPAATEEAGGCGSTISGAAVALVAVLALGAGVSFKTKED